MKIITIPDLHGKSLWKKLEVSAYDKIIFLGDYVDSKGEVPDEAEVENLDQIIALKKQFPQKVVLLIGNHDLHYLHYPAFRASAFNVKIQPQLTTLFQDNKAYFQNAFQLGNHLWTHAGVSQSWYNQHSTLFQEMGDSLNLEQKLHKMGETHLRELAEASPLRGGMSPYGGIFWADQAETRHDYLPLFHQYVGHTKVRDIMVYGDETSSIHYLDCLNSKEDYLVKTLILNE